MCFYLYLPCTTYACICINPQNWHAQCIHSQPLTDKLSSSRDRNAIVNTHNVKIIYMKTKNTAHNSVTSFKSNKRACKKVHMISLRDCSLNFVQLRRLHCLGSCKLPNQESLLLKAGEQNYAKPGKSRFSTLKMLKYFHQNTAKHIATS